MQDRIRVLFLCAGNSCRSQMAEGLLRHFDGERFEVYSAGTSPSFIHPRAIEVMAELGIDISTQRSKHVSEFKGEGFDFVISLCGESNCPSFIGKALATLHWPFPDPVNALGSGKDALQSFRDVRDAILVLVKKFILSPESFASGPEFLIQKKALP